MRDGLETGVLKKRENWINEEAIYSNGKSNRNVPRIYTGCGIRDKTDVLKKTGIERILIESLSG